MLNDLSKFWRDKSIKLSDAFDVSIRMNSKSAYDRLVNCVAFTLPKLEYEEEAYEYGNVSQLFLKPKYDSCKEVVLEFMERMETTKNRLDTSVVLNKVLKSLGYTVNQKFSQGLTTNYANYDMDFVIEDLVIKIADNKLWRYVYEYRFGNLKIVNYSTYILEYQNESPSKVSVTLAFETYTKNKIDEPIWDEG